MIEKLNGKYIGFQCTPSRWTGEPEYKKISQITMTCGGGMGGSKWYEYVERITDIPNGIRTYTTIDGKQIKLNSKYMVKIKDYTIVTVTHETSNSNYYPENNCLGSKVPYTKLVPVTLQFLIDDDFKVELYNGYSDEAKKLNRRWLKEQKYSK